MSRNFDAEAVQSFWENIQKATAQSNSTAGGQVAQRIQPMPGADLATSQAATALLASLQGTGLTQQLGRMSGIYPPLQFDNGTQAPQAHTHVEEHLLPIGNHQLQQHQQAASQLQQPSGKISSSEAFPAHLQAAVQPAQQPSGSDSDEEGRVRGAGANGDRKSQLKEKNRKAQKRFRERQKSKLAESEDKVAAMAIQLEQLHNDRLRLENRNSVLEKVLEMKEIEEAKPAASSSGPTAFEVPQETGQEIIDKFRLQQGLLLTVRPDQPINLSIEQLRRLSWEEHAAVWRDYVNALAQCLVLANGDVNSPTVERMTQLVQECLALSAGMAVANPRGTFAFHSLKMDAAAPGSPDEAPGPDYWARIVKELQLGPEEKQDLKLARRAYLTALGFIIKDRQVLISNLEAGTPNGGNYCSTSHRFLKSLDAADKLHQNMQQQQSCLLQFTMTVALRLADKFHGAILIVQSFPWSPDVLSIVDVLAAEGGEPSTETLLAGPPNQNAHEEVPTHHKAPTSSN